MNENNERDKTYLNVSKIQSSIDSQNTELANDEGYCKDETIDFDNYLEKLELNIMGNINNS